MAVWPSTEGQHFAATYCTYACFFPKTGRTSSNLFKTGYFSEIYRRVSNIYEFLFFSCFEIKRNVFTASKQFLSIPAETRSQAWAYGCSFVGTAGSNPAGGMDVCLLLVLCAVTQNFLRRAGDTPKGVLP